MSAIIKFIIKTIYNANIKPFLKNYILMESNPDYADNTRFVFEELIEQKYNEKYKIIWFVDQKEKYNDIKIKNVSFIQKDRKMKNFITCKCYNLIAKYIIDCNKYIRKMNKDQFRIHLTHGTPLKLTYEYSQQSGEFDYLIQVSDFFTDTLSNLFNVDKSKIITTGFPRNDIHFKEQKEKLNVFPEIKRRKDILWLPTYRNHKLSKDNSKYVTNINFKFGVPSINSEEEIEELNERLKKEEILLLIKLHPAENDSKITNLNLSNIKIIKDTIFEEKHLSLYHLLSECDAIITDYSSIYYDFLITKRPIGITAVDIEEYKKHVEILFDDDYESNIVGEYIYNFEDLKKFIDNIANENDMMYEERMEKINLYHKYQDGNSSKRVIKLLEERIKEDLNEKRN